MNNINATYQKQSFFIYSCVVCKRIRLYMLPHKKNVRDKRIHANWNNSSLVTMEKRLLLLEII
jgi:hypothetical protein